MALAGYSGSPLEKKLGFKEGFVIRLQGQPDYYFSLFHSLPDNLVFTQDTHTLKNCIHVFFTEGSKLYDCFDALKAEIVPNGMIWVSWPKKTSKVSTDITEDYIRDLALKRGLVDVKVCAVDEVWSGLKLVIPLKYR